MRLECKIHTSGFNELSAIDCHKWRILLFNVFLHSCNKRLKTFVVYRNLRRGRHFDTVKMVITMMLDWISKQKWISNSTSWPFYASSNRITPRCYIFDMLFKSTLFKLYKELSIFRRRKIRFVFFSAILVLTNRLKVTC